MREMHSSRFADSAITVSVGLTSEVVNHTYAQPNASRQPEILSPKQHFLNFRCFYGAFVYLFCVNLTEFIWPFAYTDMKFALSSMVKRIFHSSRNLAVIVDAPFP